MKKRILSILLTLCMVLCIVPTGVFAEDEAAGKAAAANSEVSVTVTSAAEFIKAIDDTNTRTEETTVIRIGKKFTVSLSECEGYFLIKTKVIIDLNYHGFSIKQDINSDKAFYLTDGAELTIRDSTRFQYGVLKIIGNGEKAISAVRFSGKSNATLRLESGTVEGENLEYNRKMVDGRVYGTPGGFVRLDEKNSNFIMTGGTIKSFYGVYGGAVSVEYGKFVMEGGTIQNCYARNGGAISVDYGKNAMLTIGGGSGTPIIKNNSAIGPGGGLAVSDTSSKVEIKSGLFEDNYSTGSDEAPVNLKNGAELYVGYGCEVKMSGGTIKNSGTGQYAISSEGKFTVTGDAVIDVSAEHCTLSCAGENNYFFDFENGYAIIKGRYAAGNAFPISETNGLRFGADENSLGEIKQGFRNEDISNAQYIKIAKKRTVTFKLAENEPTTLSLQTVLQGEKIQKPADPPARDGYVFNDIWAIPSGGGYIHWNFDDDVLTEDITLYGRWSGYRVKITFNANGYSMSGQSEIYGEYGQKLKDLSGVPTINPASFMKFIGWYTQSSGGTKVDENTVLTDNMTLYAKCAPQYTVFICYQYENDEGQRVTLQTMNHLDENGRVPKPSVQPVHKTGYVFDDWYVGEVSYGYLTDNYTNLKTVADLFREYGTMDGAQGRIYLVARYVERNDYSVTFKSEDSVIDTKSNLKWTDKVLDGVSVPTRDGYDFVGFKYGDKTVTADTAYADLAADDSVTSITLTAQWRDTEKPTGTIEIGTNKWYVFLNKLTFGLFFNDTQTVTITASDNSGKVSVGYYVTDADISEADFKSVVFYEYNGSFNIEQDGKYIVYAMLVDESLNITYLRSDGITIDTVSPVIGGLENGKIYCEEKTVTITEDNLHGVFVNNEPVALDENNSFVLSPGIGAQTISVYDRAGNITEITVTVNDGHTKGQDDGDCTTPVYCKYCNAEVVAPIKHDFTGAWHNDEIGHWHECQNSGCTVKDTKIAHSGTDDGDCTTEVICECGYVVKIANISHIWGEWQSNGDGTHTRRCTAKGCTAGVEAESCTDIDKDHKCDICDAVLSECSDVDKDHTCDYCGKTISAHEDTDKDHVCDYCGETISNHEDNDKNHICDYCEKTISNHTDGKATCTEKAVCEICGKTYGELDANNHTDLKHIDAKAATEDKEGNIEYWHCDGCDKYYSDKDGTMEIKKADTVTPKLPKEIEKQPKEKEPPYTGENSNNMLWITLLFISGGVCTVLTVKRKKSYRSGGNAK